MPGGTGVPAVDRDDMPDVVFQAEVRGKWRTFSRCIECGGLIMVVWLDARRGWYHIVDLAIATEDAHQ